MVVATARPRTANQQSPRCPRRAGGGRGVNGPSRCRARIRSGGDRITLSIFTASANLTSAESVAATRPCVQTPWVVACRQTGWHRRRPPGVAGTTACTRCRCARTSCRSSVCRAWPWPSASRHCRPGRGRRVGQGQLGRGHCAGAQRRRPPRGRADPAHCAATLRCLDELVRSPRRERNDRQWAQGCGRISIGHADSRIGSGDALGRT